MIGGSSRPSSIPAARDDRGRVGRSDARLGVPADPPRGAAVRPRGVAVPEPTVTHERVEATRAWCDGTGWTATRLFAPERADDVRAIFCAVAP